MLKRLSFLLLVLLLAGHLYAEEEETEIYKGPVWYISNASGMALEYIQSGLAALRHEYCISVDTIPFHLIPSDLIKHYGYGYTIEMRVLYQKGEIYRRQWIFRDDMGITRVNAAGLMKTDLELIEDENDEENYDEEDNEDAVQIIIEYDERAADIYFIEVYDQDHYLTEEHQYNAGIERMTIYNYSGGLLVRTETWISDGSTDSGVAPDYTDIYRYTRSSSLRAIERTYHSEITETVRTSISFPGIVPGVSREPEFINPGHDHGQVFPEGTIPANTRAIYTTDSRGRVLTETRLDEEGEVIGELQNTWDGDRLKSVYWKSGNDERLTEFEYDSKGDRVIERNFYNNVLERMVRAEGNREIEELYVDGRIMLRAVWENGRKISEERVR